MRKSVKEKVRYRLNIFLNDSMDFYCHAATICNNILVSAKKSPFYLSDSINVDKLVENLKIANDDEKNRFLQESQWVRISGKKACRSLKRIDFQTAFEQRIISERIYKIIDFDIDGIKKFFEDDHQDYVELCHGIILLTEIMLIFIECRSELEKEGIKIDYEKENTFVRNQIEQLQQDLYYQSDEYYEMLSEQKDENDS